MRNDKLIAGALAVLGSTLPAQAQDCDPAETTCPQTGFAITVNGNTRSGSDARLAELQRQVDVALAAADIRVQFEGLDAERSLGLSIDNANGADAGDRVSFTSHLNYPHFTARGEIRVVDAGARGGARTLAVLPVTPGQTISYTLPEGEDLQVIHRVYAADGRFDETQAQSIASPANDPENLPLARRNIRITGGAVTVSGSDLPANTRVRIMGDVITTDRNGRFATQRILPVGNHAVDIAASTVDLTREVAVPGAEWFYIGLVDVTLGWRTDDSKDSAGRNISGSYNRGRIAAYVNGRTANGTRIIASVDSREEELKDIFRNLDERDPRSLLRRVDPDDLYPTYGDDSSITETAPTSGRFYVRVEKDGNHIVFGNYRANVAGSQYIRNERTLYGFQGHWESDAQTSNGDARASLDVYAAQPDNLPGRDIFRGTGGSVYFLSKQDISRGSETLSIEIRDPQSGRVLERRTLTYGTDYDINYIQGVIRLRQPLSAYGGGNSLISDNPSDQNTAHLVAQYEWTPTSTDVDGYSYGARAQAWVNDQLRVGVSGQVETTGTADQTATGADIRWQHSERSFVELEYARSDGPGFGTNTSTDGGLTVDENAATGGTGSAIRLRAQGDLEELGLNMPGLIGAYYEQRDAGFTSLDYSVTSDETLWGVWGEMGDADANRLRFYVDTFENDDGKRDNTAGFEYFHTLREGMELTFGAEHLDRVTPGNASDTGKRTDLAARLRMTPSDALSWYVFAQGTANVSGGLSRNNRAGIGADIALGDRWRLDAEVSDGTRGAGARAIFSFDDGQGRNRYFGYTLDPDESLSSIATNGKNRGQYVLGGSRQVNDSTQIFAENTYNTFSKRRDLTSTYGLNYNHSDYTDYSFSLEYGTIRDDAGGDFRRTALSFGYGFDNDITAASARLELRRERGIEGGKNRDSDTVIFAGDLKHQFSASARFLGSLDVVYTDADSPTLQDTQFAELSLGYALRPVTNDRLNILARYRYVFDEYGQTSGGSSNRGDLQHSHILSLDAEYDLNPQWSIGGKIGYRASETAAAGTNNFTSNNAWLALANARYHMTHTWDLLGEVRMLHSESADTTDYGALLAGYRHVGDNVKLGLGYNFGRFSDDLADLTHDEKGLFLNLIAKF